jgi:hypothetical protein
MMPISSSKYITSLKMGVILPYYNLLGNETKLVRQHITIILNNNYICLIDMEKFHQISLKNKKGMANVL